MIGKLCLFLGPRFESTLRPLGRILDGAYVASGTIAGFFMMTILAL